MVDLGSFDRLSEHYLNSTLFNFLSLIHTDLCAFVNLFGVKSKRLSTFHLSVIDMFLHEAIYLA